MTDPRTQDCARLAARVAEILDRDLCEQPLPALRAHATDCGPCAALLAAHRALAATLATVPPVPTVAVPVPDLPLELEETRRPSGRLLGPASLGRRALAAAAAAALIAVGVQAWNAHQDAAGPVGVPVRVVSIEVEPAGPWSADEDLMALTAGWEAVASLRPARPR